MRQFHILSLDGGGTWALIQVLVLQDLFGKTARGHDVLRNFDLVVANSGGSIVAAGLWKNWTLETLAQALGERTLRMRIYDLLPAPFRVLRLFGFGPKYRSRRKLEGLRDLLGVSHDEAVPGYTPIDLSRTRMTELRRTFVHGEEVAPDLLVIGFNYDRARGIFFRTRPRAKALAPDAGAAAVAAAEARARTATLAEAVHASTHAPVNYFRGTARIEHESRPLNCWDGAITGFNNPILAGITEAVARGVPRQSIRVLSLGTGSVFLPEQLPGGMAGQPWLFNEPQKPSLFGDVAKLALSIISDPPDMATYIAHLMLGGLLPAVDRETASTAPYPIVRMSPLIQPLVQADESGVARFVPPRGRDGQAYDEARFRRLMDLDLDAVEDADVKLLEEFARDWMAGGFPNQPILASSSSLACELGHRFYLDAKTEAVGIGLAPVEPIAPREEHVPSVARA